METSLIIPDNLDEFYKNKDIVWDFENNPCLFPLYLFQKFHSTYCVQEKIEEADSTYYSRKSVYCEYKEPSLPKCYTAWFIVTTRWNHVTFYLQIGKDGFVPFYNDNEYAKGLVSYINFQVFNGKVTVHLNIDTSSGFNILFINNKIAQEITEELKKHGLSI